MEIFFEKITEDDFNLYYELRCDQENILWTGHAERPDIKNLRNWFLKQIERKDRIFFLVKSKELPNEAMGYLYLDIVGVKNNVIETGHGVHSKFKGKGIGTKIIKFAVEFSSENLLFIDRNDGWIAHDNIGSIKNFLKNGYSETNETKKHFFKSINDDVLMKKFTRKITH